MTPERAAALAVEMISATAAGLRRRAVEMPAAYGQRADRDAAMWWYVRGYLAETAKNGDAELAAVTRAILAALDDPANTLDVPDAGGAS